MESLLTILSQYIPLQDMADFITNWMNQNPMIAAGTIGGAFAICIANFITMVTPTSVSVKIFKDKTGWKRYVNLGINLVLSMTLKLLNKVACNFLKNRNADEKKKK